MIPTAKEFLNSNSLKGHVVMDSVDEEGIERDMIEFAKLHVQAALKAVIEKVEVEDVGSFNGDGEWMSYVIVDRESIFNAYPENLIK